MDNDLLNQAIQAIKNGDKETGRKILFDLVKREPRNESAWLWLAASVQSDKQRIDCLKMVLAINPENQNAKIALSKIQKVEEPTLEALIPNIQPSTNPPNAVVSIQYQSKAKIKDLPKDKKSIFTKTQWIILGGVAGFSIILIISLSIISFIINISGQPTQVAVFIPTNTMIKFPSTWTPTPPKLIKPTENQRITEAQKINSTNTAVANNEKQYEQQIKDILTQNSNTMDEMISLSNLVKDNPSLSSQPEFQANYHRLMNNIKSNLVIIRQMIPPPRFAEAHKLLIEAINHYEAAIDLSYDGWITLNEATFSKATTEETIGVDYIQKYYHAMGWK
jgi:hypothetical protein